MLVWQSNFLQKRLLKRVGYSGKKVVDGCTVDISQELKDKKIKIDNDVFALVKQCNNNPQNIVDYLREHDIEVYCVKRLKNLLNFIKESEGFISERKGFKGLLLNLHTGSGFKFKTKPLIILEGNPDIYRLIRYFYTWYSWKNGMEGFDEKSQRLLWTLHAKDEDKVISRLSLPDMDLLNNAIARDVQAIEFVTKYSKETAGAKNALEKMKQDGGANI